MKSQGLRNDQHTHYMCDRKRASKTKLKKQYNIDLAITRNVPVFNN